MRLQSRVESGCRVALSYLARLQVRASVWGSSARLRRLLNTRVLLDNSILRLGVLHRTVAVSLGEFQFGNSRHEVTIPHLTHDNFRAHERWLSEQQKFLPSIAHLGEAGLLDLFTSAELQRETWQHKPSKYTGDPYGSSLFASNWVGVLPSPVRRSVSRIMSDYDWTTEEQRDFFRTIRDAEFIELSRYIGEKHISDAFHIWSAHKIDCHTFLTVDKKLINVVQTLKGQGKINWLRTQVQCPKEFAGLIGSRPVNIDHLLFSDPLLPILRK